MNKPGRRIELSGEKLEEMSKEEVDELLLTLRSLGHLSLDVRFIETREKKSMARRAKRQAELPKFDKEVLAHLDTLSFEDTDQFMISKGLNKESVAKVWNGLARFSYAPDKRDIIRERRPGKDGHKLRLLVTYNKQRQNSGAVGYIQFASPEVINDEYCLDPIELASAIENDELVGSVATFGDFTVDILVSLLNQQIEVKKQELSSSPD